MASIDPPDHDREALEVGLPSLGDRAVSEVRRPPGPARPRALQQSNQVPGAVSIGLHERVAGKNRPADGARPAQPRRNPIQGATAHRARDQRPRSASVDEGPRRTGGQPVTQGGLDRLASRLPSLVGVAGLHDHGADRFGPADLASGLQREVLELGGRQAGLDLQVSGARAAQPLLPPVTAGADAPDEELAPRQPGGRGVHHARPVGAQGRDPLAPLRLDLEEVSAGCAARDG